MTITHQHFEPRHTRPIPDNRFIDPFALPAADEITRRTVSLRHSWLAASLRRLAKVISLNAIVFSIGVLAVSVLILVVVAAFTPKPIAAPPDPRIMAGLADRDAPIVRPKLVSTITPDSINAAMSPASQTTVFSIDPLPVHAAAIAQ